MKYIALLRGINVGGNNIIKMIALREAFEKAGFSNVLTYIQSGNVIFESKDRNVEKITESIESLLSKTFKYNARVVVRSEKQLKKVLEEVPGEWKKREDIRRYVAFIKEPMTSKSVLSEIDLNKEVDSAKAGDGVIYMTTLLSGLTRSGFTKMVSKKIYKEMTIRNYNTTQKIFSLMRQ